MQSGFWAESLACRVETAALPWKKFFIKHLFKHAPFPVSYKHSCECIGVLARTRECENMYISPPCK